MPRPGLPLAACLLAAACAPHTPTPTSDAGTDTGNRTARTAPLTLGHAPDGAGPFLRVPLSLNGGPALQVLLDTGSEGLRVLESALGESTVERTDRPVQVEFGAGDRMSGVLAHATVQVGEVSTPGPIAFHLVESLSCAPGHQGCDVFAPAGLQGILGVSTRPGVEPDIYSPFAQLSPEDAAGFALHVEDPVGHITFGAEALAAPGDSRLALPRAGLHPDGRPAFRDDAVQACLRVNGAETAHSCTDTVFDTGASPDIVYAPGLPEDTVVDGLLAPGTRLEVSLPGLWTRVLTVGAYPEPGRDAVIVDGSIPFSILGLGWFRRFDVFYDLRAGELGFREPTP